MKSPLKLFLIAAVSTGGLNAATLSILDGLAGPSGTVLAENFSASSLGGETFAKGRSHGQTFTVADGTTIDKIAVAFYNFQEPVDAWTDTVTFSFYSVSSDAEAATLVTVSLLDSVSFSIADLAPSLDPGDTFTLSFDVANTTASTGDVFAWQFTGVPGGSTGTWASIRQTRTSADQALISPGRAYLGTNAVTDERDNFTYVVAAIPEPSSMLLVAFGGLALMRRRR